MFQFVVLLRAFCAFQKMMTGCPELGLQFIFSARGDRRLAQAPLQRKL
jgi:hypothetical protein